MLKYKIPQIVTLTQNKLILMDEMQYLISFLLLRVEKRLIHYSYEKVEPFIISIPGSYGSHSPIM